MNHDYQKVKETFAEIDIDESYIGKTLRLYGLEEFPKSGLDDIGLSKLVKTATEISYSESSLTTRKPKKGYLPAPKIEKEKPNSKSLEAQIIEEDTKKFKEGIKKGGRGLLKAIIYPTIGTNLLAPTMIRKLVEWEDNNPMNHDSDTLAMLGFFEFLGVHIVGYCELVRNNPKLIPYIIGTEVITNLGSLYYEWRRSIKNKAEKRIEEVEEDTSLPRNINLIDKYNNKIEEYNNY